MQRTSLPAASRGIRDGAKRFNQRWARQRRKHQRRQERQRLARRQKTEAAVLAHVQQHGLESPAIADAPRTSDLLAGLPAEQRESLERAMHRRRIRASMRPATCCPTAVRPPRIRRCIGRHETRPGHRVASDSRVSPRSGAGRVARSGGGSGGGGSGDDGGSEPPAESDDDRRRLAAGEAANVAAPLAELFPARLSVGVGDDGRSVVLHRHAGCPNTNVLAAVDRDRDEQGARRRRP